jgi:hypothetical protein
MRGERVRRGGPKVGHLGFVVSHPVAGKKATGWGTELQGLAGCVHW